MTIPSAPSMLKAQGHGLPVSSPCRPTNPAGIHEDSCVVALLDLLNIGDHQRLDPPFRSIIEGISSKSAGPTAQPLCFAMVSCSAENSARTVLMHFLLYLSICTLTSSTTSRRTNCWLPWRDPDLRPYASMLLLAQPLRHGFWPLPMPNDTSLTSSKPPSTDRCSSGTILSHNIGPSWSFPLSRSGKTSKAMPPEIGIK